VAHAHDELPERVGRTPVAPRWLKSFELVEREQAQTGLLARMLGWLKG
jgi:hypothetical protein